MEVYKHEFFESRKEIKTTPLEAEIRSGAYKLTGMPYAGSFKINELIEGYNLHMYTTTPDTRMFIKSTRENPLRKL